VKGTYFEMGVQIGLNSVKPFCQLCVENATSAAKKDARSKTSQNWFRSAVIIPLVFGVLVTVVLTVLWKIGLLIP